MSFQARPILRQDGTRGTLWSNALLTRRFLGHFSAIFRRVVARKNSTKNGDKQPRDMR